MDPRERFVAAVNAPAAEMQLDLAALCIAAHAHRQLDIDAAMAHLDDLAASCPAADFDSLRLHLFDRVGFVGNLDNYEDPENSFLDSVIARRIGIPISLSVLMISVARRLDIDAQGVGMPGHFLVLDGSRGTVWCDPFHGGALLDPAGCRRRFDLVYGGAMPFQLAFLAPTPPAAIVARILANLERGKLATDPVQRAWMCGLHLDIPGITFDERMLLADQLAATGDVMRAATEFEALAADAAAREDAEPGADPSSSIASVAPASSVSKRLLNRVRALRAGLN